MRGSNGYLTAGRDGAYLFQNVVVFALDQPFIFTSAVQRDRLPALQIPPSYDRSFRYRQFFGFAQDTWKLTPHLTINFGLRYELFGSPSNTGSVKDSLVQLGPGSNLPAQLAGATLPVPRAGNQKLFGTDTKDIAPRIGASFDLFGTGRTLLREATAFFTIVPSITCGKCCATTALHWRSSLSRRPTPEPPSFSP